MPRIAVDFGEGITRRNSERPDFDVLEPDRPAMVLQRDRPGVPSIDQDVPDRRPLRPTLRGCRAGFVGFQRPVQHFLSIDPMFEVLALDYQARLVPNARGMRGL